MTPNELANKILNNHFKTKHLVHLGSDTSHGQFYAYDDKSGIWIERDIKEIEGIVDSIDPEASNTKYANTCKKLAIRAAGNVEMNSHANLINLQNGMYDPITDELFPHAYDYYSTIQLNFKLDREARPTKWLKFLDTIFYEEEEKGQIPTLQEFMGYSFLPRASFQKALLFHGSAGTGKSTVEAVWMKMFKEDTYTATGLKDISNPRSIYRFHNSLVNFSDETQEGMKLDGEIFKQIVGGITPIEGVKIYSEAIKFVPFTRMVILTNHLPIIVDSSNATWRRLLLLSVSRQIPDEEKILNFENTLIDEIPAIFNWCMEGYRRLEQNQCFSECLLSKKLLGQYKVESDPVEQFVLYQYRGINIGDFVEVSIREIFDDYCEWFKGYTGEGGKAMHVSQRTFTSRIREKFNKQHNLFVFTDKKLTDGVRGFTITCVGKEDEE
jgi:putative DNA primase/helicase